MRNRPKNLFSLHALLFLALLVMPLTGCIGLISHGLYVLKGDKVPAAYKGLQGKRVAVVCVAGSPASGPSSPPNMIAREVGRILSQRVEGLELVRADEVADWIDRNQWNEIDYTQVGEGVQADLVVALDLEAYRLREGATLFKGKASVHTTVFDIANDGTVVYETSTFDFTYPENGARHSTETSESSFRRLFIRGLARQLAKDFFAYDRKEDFAYDVTSISGN
ncbi:MAG: hypothetical protein VX715_06130 [Planctomycetota bacterium]|nr:hypothetical protein [Planctomycetota bacterium]